MVYDNGSMDKTYEVAEAAGAVVRKFSKPGKGAVLRRMFSDVEADFYFIVDGDATYDPSIAPMMLEKLCSENLDMVIGVRKASRDAYRFGHNTGNKVISFVTSFLFGNCISDALSGYRVMTRAFVKSFPCISGGFEIETELNAYALRTGSAIEEIECHYSKRQEGSESKLRTYTDGISIIWHLLYLFAAFRPTLCFLILSFLVFFTFSYKMASTLSFIFFATLLFISVTRRYEENEYVERKNRAVQKKGSIGINA